MISFFICVCRLCGRLGRWLRCRPWTRSGRMSRRVSGPWGRITRGHSTPHLTRSVSCHTFLLYLSILLLSDGQMISLLQWMCESLSFWDNWCLFRTVCPNKKMLYFWGKQQIGYRLKQNHNRHTGVFWPLYWYICRLACLMTSITSSPHSSG